MRFIHIADLHLGFRSYDKEKDFNPFLSLQFAAQYAIEKNIKLFIIAGDIFDRRDPPAFIQRGFAHTVKELVQNEVKVFILTGNHEGAPNPRRDIHLDLYDELEIEGVVIAKTIGYYRLDSLNIITVPYPFKRNLLSKDEYREKSEKEIGHIMNEKIFSGIDYFLEKIDRKVPTILVAHLPLSEGEVGEEKYIYFAADVPVSTEQLDRKEFSYIAMGHFHKMQIISTKKFGHPVVYPGSLDRINFGEETDKKGFFDVEISESTGKTSFMFVENPFARKFYTIRINNDGDIDAVQWDRVKESVVRIILSDDLQNEKLFKKLVDRAKKEAKIFAGMEDKRAVQNNIVRSNMNLSISPGEAVEKYIKRQDSAFVKKHGEEIFKRAISFLKEE
ncbi:MAG: exonuclease subunit SbcD [Caldisericota bacterium]|nr:exonuclease subunit SbcD [Caldisericota bacterium]